VQALQILKTTQKVDLMISDVGLPGHMNGRQLAAAGRKLRPHLKVLFITGNAETAASADDPAGHDVEIMSKPFGSAELERKVFALTSGSTTSQPG
jgi:CheY-like chemotaxis protein